MSLESLGTAAELSYILGRCVLERSQDRVGVHTVCDQYGRIL